MRKRDVDILKDLERFRVMSRDHIAGLYFSNTKSPVTNANFVLKRLIRDGYIKAHTKYRPYAYSLKEEVMKTNSRKIMHFLGIVDCYQMFKEEYAIEEFLVEPKFEKGFMEPDGLMRLDNGCSFFIELQRKFYTAGELNEKLTRYQKYYYSFKWKEVFKEFPPIWFVSYFEIKNMPEVFPELTILQKKLPEKSVRYEKVTL